MAAVRWIMSGLVTGLAVVLGAGGSAPWGVFAAVMAISVMVASRLLVLAVEGTTLVVPRFVSKSAIAELVFCKQPARTLRRYAEAKSCLTLSKL